MAFFCYLGSVDMFPSDYVDSGAVQCEWRSGAVLDGPRDGGSSRDGGGSSRDGGGSSRDGDGGSRDGGGSSRYGGGSSRGGGGSSRDGGFGQYEAVVAVMIVAAIRRKAVIAR